MVDLDFKTRFQILLLKRGFTSISAFSRAIDVPESTMRHLMQDPDKYPKVQAKILAGVGLQEWGEI